MVSTPEGDFKRRFCKELKKLHVIPVQYQQTATTLAGFPDCFCIAEGVTFYLEFKASSRSKFRPGQKEWIKRLQDLNHFAWVVTPETADEVLAEIKEIL